MAYVSVMKKLIELLSAVYAFNYCNLNIGTKTFKTCSGNELVMVRATRNRFVENKVDNIFM